jgi:hypothetical protein
MAEVTITEQLVGLAAPGGTVSAFNLAYTPIVGSLLFFENQAYQIPNVDYTLTGKIITITPAPSSFTFRADYAYDSTIVHGVYHINHELLTDNASVSTSLFNLAHTPISGTLQIFVNGTSSFEMIDYRSLGKIIAFFTPQIVGNIVTASYDYIVDPVTPDGITGSTTLNPVITAYDPLLIRIKRTMGWPLIEVEVCDDNIYDNINQAIEWYSKYAGYTEEYLVFASDLYKEPGLRIDKLFTLTATMRESLSNGLSASWDYDLRDYRKVIGVFEFQPGESTGINALFTLEQAMAQQTYFSYMLGNVGFDLITWECLKSWLDLRSKVLAQISYVDFDNRTQILRLIPPPNKNSRFYGVVGCWVERSIRDLIKERWVYQYALALTKINIGNVRGKYSGTQLFGGGTINYNDLLSQGLEEKKKLEEELMKFYGEVTPARFFIG